MYLDSFMASCMKYLLIVRKINSHMQGWIIREIALYLLIYSIYIIIHVYVYVIARAGVIFGIYFTSCSSGG